MTKLIELLPTRLKNVIDLVREAGVDVADWSNSSCGPAGASTNPKYCYEWSFTEPGQVVVLSLWYRDMEEVDGDIILRGNFREDAARYAQLPKKSGWVRRARKIDEAIRLAAIDDLPLRAIINLGNDRAAKIPN